MTRRMFLVTRFSVCPQFTTLGGRSLTYVCSRLPLNWVWFDLNHVHQKRFYSGERWSTGWPALLRLYQKRWYHDLCKKTSLTWCNAPTTIRIEIPAASSLPLQLSILSLQVRVASLAKGTSRKNLATFSAVIGDFSGVCHDSQSHRSLPAAVGAEMNRWSHSVHYGYAI